MNINVSDVLLKILVLYKMLFYYNKTIKIKHIKGYIDSANLT